MVRSGEPLRRRCRRATARPVGRGGFPHSALVERTIPELGGDLRIEELLGTSIEANVDTMLHALRYDIAVERVEAPTTALSTRADWRSMACRSTRWCGRIGWASA